MCNNCDYTIHGRHHHFGWDNSFVPAQRVAPGS
ncbi:acetamidase, partial [Mesorhizobium sp. M00.F.Ca.ET.158.01.1.1]